MPVHADVDWDLVGDYELDREPLFARLDSVRLDEFCEEVLYAIT